MNATQAAELIGGLVDALDTSMYDDGDLYLADAIDMAVKALNQSAGMESRTSLWTLMDQQAKLMDKLGVMRSAHWLTSPLLKDTLVQLAGEAHEAIDPLMVATKPWKQGINEGKILEEVSKEVTDIFFFLMEVWILLGWSPVTVATWYNDKYQENLRRINMATNHGEI